MRLKVIACKVLSRELGMLSAQCPNFLDITYLRQGFHDEPDRLRAILAGEIAALEGGDSPYCCARTNGDIDAVVLAYGLCSNGVAGLSSERYTIVTPRAHDCITLFLGSKERYAEYFDGHPGTYWYTPGWMENTIMPSERSYTRHFERYKEQYGEENAEYLTEMELSWLKNYNNCAYVSFPGCELSSCEDDARRGADYLGWRYDPLKGDASLLRDLLWGCWDEERFLVTPPGGRIEASFDERIIKNAEL